jgi:hypothetical protein
MLYSWLVLQALHKSKRKCKEKGFQYSTIIRVNIITVEGKLVMWKEENVIRFTVRQITAYPTDFRLLRRT